MKVACPVWEGLHIDSLSKERNYDMSLLHDAKRARFVARVGGVLYFIIIALGALGEAAVRGSIVVPGNATAKSINLGLTQGAL